VQHLFFFAAVPHTQIKQEQCCHRLCGSIVPFSEGYFCLRAFPANSSQNYTIWGNKFWQLAVLLFQFFRFISVETLLWMKHFFLIIMKSS